MAARTLGEPIEKGHGLHPELQRTYLKRKGSADSASSNVLRTCETVLEASGTTRRVADLGYEFEDGVQCPSKIKE